MTSPTRPFVVGVFGESGVGKTSFLSMFMKGDTEALGRNKSTSLVSMNASSRTKVITVEGGEDVSQTAHCCDAFVVMYSVDKKSSLEKAITICQRIYNTRELKTCPIVIVGNKSDLKGMDEGTRKSLVDTTLSCKHMTVSAKLNQRIKPVFQYLLDQESIPLSCSGKTYKVQEQKSTPEQSHSGGNSNRRRSDSLSCTKSDKPLFQGQKQMVGVSNRARIPKDHCVIRELKEERDDHESDNASKERDDKLEGCSQNEQFRPGTSLSSDNLNERGLSSVDSGYQSVSEFQAGKIQVIKSNSFGSVNIPVPTFGTALRNKTEEFGSIGHQRSECGEASALKLQGSKSKSITPFHSRRSFCDTSSNYKAQGNNSKTLKPVNQRRSVCYANKPKTFSSVYKHRSVCERPLDLQVQKRKCKESSSVEMRLPLCKVPLDEGRSCINIDRKSSICDVPLPLVTQRKSQVLGAKSFRPSLGNQSSILKMAQNKSDKMSLSGMKAPQQKVKKVSFGDFKHPSVNKLPSLEDQRNKPERLSSVDSSYLSVCDTLQNIKARRSKHERFSLDGPPVLDATSDLRISGNTNICYLTPVKETVQRDRTRSFDKSVPVRKSKLRHAMRPRVNCHVPLSDSEIRSLRRDGKGCSVM